MRPLLAALPLALLATAATADEMADELCPILAADYASAIPEAVQAQLVMRAAGAYEYDPDALHAVLDGADAATTSACPAERAAVLKAADKASLTEVMR